MGSVSELVWIIALIAVTGAFVLTACLCVVAKVADNDERKCRRGKGER